jgi:DNA processing protein
MDQGREVFAVPGNITSKMSWGPNLLIKQGAKLVQEWTDVTNELPAAVRRDLVAKAQQKVLSEGIEPIPEMADNGPQAPLKQLAGKLLNCCKLMWRNNLSPW